MDDKLNRMIDKCTNVMLKTDDWYSWPNQRKLTYLLAKELLLTEDISPANAVKKAQQFHKDFYEIILKYKD